MPDIYDVEFTFEEPLIGTTPMNKEIYTDYIVSKAPEEKVVDDELETVVEELEKSMTGFHMHNENQILYDYMIKGFFKDACGMLRRIEKAEEYLSKDVKAYKKIIDGLVFVKPRQIPIANGTISVIERPLRASTPKGDRVALARSEMMSAGSTLKFQVRVLGQVKEALLREWFDYGALRGMGQWRNAGYGVFSYKMIKQ